MTDRRGFLGRAAAAVGGLFAALFGVPAAATLIDPALRGAGSSWVDAGSAVDLTAGAPRRFTFEVEAGWERRRDVGYLVRDGADVLAFHARCTHLGCRVRPGADGFVCPCHDGAFSRRGEPVTGPPEAPLTRFETRVRKGRVEVRIRPGDAFA